MNSYIGHPSQILGVEEHRLTGGKGDGMRLLQVRNGLGLEFTVSLDRCADISRLSLFSHNIGFFAPCSYVAPSYYDNVGNGFLKSFTGGFLTTCGLTAVGSACEDNGESCLCMVQFQTLLVKFIHIQLMKRNCNRCPNQRCIPL